MGRTPAQAAPVGQDYERKLYKLKWPEGHDLHGLEVTTKGLSMKQAFKMGRLAARLGSGDDIEGQLGALDELLAGFARKLVSWNLKEDGVPVPATLEGVEDQDMGMMIGLITAWIDAVSSVDTPLPSGSKSGPSQAPEASLPTESLSPSLQS
jgi:hypothetical protein